MNIRDPTGKLARWSIYLQQYDYTIIHRKGRKHSNVDTLSRPVLVLQVNSSTSADSPTLPSYLSDVDPHEDEALLNYLQFGRHLNGQSKKKCKNVVFRAKHYKFQNDKLWYRKDIKTDHYLEVPKRQQRYNLIQHEHFMGHYQTATVLAALTPKYYWPQMRIDIMHYIKHCETCQRLFSDNLMFLAPSLFTLMLLDMLLVPYSHSMTITNKNTFVIMRHAY
jgi:hypothetical protein